MTNLEENKVSFNAQLNILHEMSKLARKIRKHKTTEECSDLELWNQKQTTLENHYKELEASLKGA
jgi:cell division protein ZapA (FtsZ GTPase activity inhibitor)